MKKSIISLLLAGLIALSFAGCSSEPVVGAPVLNEFFYTLAIPKGQNPALSEMQRVDKIVVNRINDEKRFDFKNYAMVIAFEDEYMDVKELHVSWDDFQNTEEVFPLNQEYLSQYNYWSGIGWQLPDNATTLTLSAYLVDSAGNRSNRKSFSLNVVFGD